MPAALNEWPTGPSAAADFCNKIGQKVKSRLVCATSGLRSTTDIRHGERHV